MDNLLQYSLVRSTMSRKKREWPLVPPRGQPDAFVLLDFALPAAVVLCCAYAGMMAFTPLGQVLETLA